MGSATNDVPIVELQENLDKQNEEEIEDLEWTADQEILLLYSLHGYKPVDRLSNAMNKNISSKAIWDKLNSFYDLESLDESEAEAEAQKAVETDFVLPEDEYGELMGKKLREPVVKIEKDDMESENMHDTGEIFEVKMEPEFLFASNDTENSTEVADILKAGGTKDSRRDSVKRGPKKKESTLVKDVVTLKKESTKETSKKDTPNKKEIFKEAKKGTIKEEDKKGLVKTSQENTKNIKETKDAKEDKKESPTKGVKTTDRKLTEQTRKDVDIRKTEQKKVIDSPKNQRFDSVKHRTETPKLRTETPKRVETKTLRSETPKPQRLETLKKESSTDKKKEVIEKRLESKSPEKTPDNGRGAKLRTRERKEPESEKSETPTGTKRERSRDSTSKASENQTEEPVVKRPKTPALKGRPTRNSIEPQQKPISPVVNPVSPQKRRTRLL